MIWVRLPQKFFTYIYIYIYIYIMNERIDISKFVKHFLLNFLILAGLSLFLSSVIVHLHFKTKRVMNAKEVASQAVLN